LERSDIDIQPEPIQQVEIVEVFEILPVDVLHARAFFAVKCS